MFKFRDIIPAKRRSVRQIDGAVAVIETAIKALLHEQQQLAQAQEAAVERDNARQRETDRALKLVDERQAFIGALTEEVAKLRTSLNASEEVFNFVGDLSMRLAKLEDGQKVSVAELVTAMTDAFIKASRPVSLLSLPSLERSKDLYEEALSGGLEYLNGGAVPAIDPADKSAFLNGDFAGLRLKGDPALSVPEEMRPVVGFDISANAEVVTQDMPAGIAGAFLNWARSLPNGADIYYSQHFRKHVGNDGSMFDPETGEVLAAPAKSLDGDATLHGIGNGLDDVAAPTAPIAAGQGDATTAAEISAPLDPAVVAEPPPELGENTHLDPDYRERLIDEVTGRRDPALGVPVAGRVLPVQE